MRRRLGLRLFVPTLAVSILAAEARRSDRARKSALPTDEHALRRMIDDSRFEG